MAARQSVKGVVLYFDPVSRELCISSSTRLQLPDDALEMVRVPKTELDELPPEEVARRISGTVLGALEILSRRA